MLKEKTQENTYAACSQEGSFIMLMKVDSGQIKSMLNIALLDLDTVNVLKQTAPKESGQWNAVFKLGYDVLHALCEAFIIFDKIKARTHECLFAYLCEKHKELELDWLFFEKIRRMRNGTQYYGEPVSYENWKSIELQITLYINTLKKEILKKLS